MMAKISDKIIKIVTTKGGLLDRSQVIKACDCLTNGGVIAVPTDTIYGLAAKVDDTKALKRIYQIKGRDACKPLAVCLSHIDSISEVADIQDINPRILPCLLPGPITILLKRNKTLNPDLNPGLETVGIRIPDHLFLNVVNAEVGPLALTSANRSGDLNPLIIEDFEDLHHEIDIVFNGAQTQMDTLGGDVPKDNDRLGSTVIDLTKKNFFSIVRHGCALNRTISILTRFGLREYSKKDEMR